jgi:hypothetical protein
VFPQRNSEEIVDLINTFLRLLETASRLPAGAERQAVIAPIQEFHEDWGDWYCEKRLGRRDSERTSHLYVRSTCSASLHHMRAEVFLCFQVKNREHPAM